MIPDEKAYKIVTVSTNSQKNQETKLHVFKFNVCCIRVIWFIVPQYNVVSIQKYILMVLVLILYNFSEYTARNIRKNTGVS